MSGAANVADSSLSAVDDFIPIELFLLSMSIEVGIALGRTIVEEILFRG